MSFEKDQSRQPHGKTIFIEYSSAKSGQHFITVLQTLPGQNKKVLIGRVYAAKVHDQIIYTAKSADGKLVLAVSEHLSEVKKGFKKNGAELALKEISKAEISVQDETPGAQAIGEQSAEQKTPQKHKQKTSEQEIREIRENKTGKGQDKSITR